ncbi:MAG: hypothetical protein ACK5LJ_14940 [Paracoccus sp. (in: a-proteobacteria)]
MIRPAAILLVLALIGDAAMAQDLAGQDFAALRKAAPADAAQAATPFLNAGREAFAGQRWAAAYKGFAESALIWPTPEALCASAAALAMVPRANDSCENGHAGKLADLSRAYVLLAEAAQISSEYGDTAPFGTEHALGMIHQASEDLRGAVAACAGN